MSDKTNLNDGLISLLKETNDRVYALTFERYEAQQVLEDDGVEITDDQWDRIVQRLNDEFMCDEMWNRFWNIVTKEVKGETST